MIEPHSLTEAELDSIRHLIPDPEPALGRPSPTDGEPAPAQPLRVSEPLLDGNEAAYVAECVSAGLDLLGRRLRAPVRGRVRGRGRLRARGRLLERDRGPAPGAGRRRGRPRATRS